MIKTIFSAGLIAFLFTAVSFADQNPSMSVMSEGGNTTTVEVTPDSIGVDTSTVDGQQGLRILYRGASIQYDTSGGYLREYIPVLVGVFSRQIRVQVVQMNYKSVQMMAPVRSPGSPVNVRPETVSQFLSYDQPYEQRRHFVTCVRVYPYSYDSTSGTYEILSSIVFQVTSEGSGVRTENATTDPLLSRTLVNYDQVKDAIVGGPNRVYKTEASSVLSQGTWYKLAVTQSGIYKVTYSQLKSAGVPIDNADISTIQIYNDGGRELPEDPTVPQPDGLTENAIYVYDANGTGKFSSNDYILFYGQGTKSWDYIDSTNTFSHYTNLYSDTNYYFITWGGGAGKRMAVVPSVHASNYYRPQTFQYEVFQDTSMYNLLGSGQSWFGPKLYASGQGNSSYTFQSDLYGLDQADSISYTVALVSRSGVSNEFAVSEDATGLLLGTIQGQTVDLSAIQGPYAVRYTPPPYVGPGNLPGDESKLTITYSAAGNSSSSTAYINWLEVLYHRYFQAVGDVLNFYSPDTTANVYYSVSGFSNNDVKVFDVTDFSNVEMVQPDSIDNGTVYFGTQTQSGSRKQFFAVGDNGYLKVSAIESVPNSDLTGNVAGADLIIVTAPEFLQQANELASWKESHDNLKTQVVTTTDIYDEFDCGIPDPTAIRNYLMYSYRNDQLIPSYVILFGAGSYDYKSRVAPDTEFVPPYESKVSLDQAELGGGTFCSDDYFVQFNSPLGDGPISMAIGRLPVTNQQEANAVVNKIEIYESGSDFGTWRNVITLVADDDVTTGVVNDVGDPSFTYDTQELEGFIPGSFDLKQIFIALYPTVVTTDGRRKPEAAAAIINQINQGTLLMNYVGHGAPTLWSYAHIFESPVAIPQLTNLHKLSFFVTATCDFGLDDDPTQEGGSQALVNDPNGGAIGAVSSTRVGYEGPNASFDDALFADLLTWNAQRLPPRIGEALFKVKQNQYSVDAIKYNLLGDPTLRLDMPEFQASIDSLNGKSLDSTQDIKALEKIRIVGSVYQPDSALWTGLSTTGTLTIYDSDTKVLIPQWGTSFNFPGSILFRGQVSITNGKFEAETVIPKDISYSNQSGKIELYFEGGGSDGLGYTRNVIVGGTDTSVTNNHVAPEISIYFDSKSFKSGDIVSSNPTMIVDLHAVNGLNLSDVSVGHGLQAIFDGGQTVNLAPYYTGTLNSYQDGTVTYPVTQDLSYGEHTVTVRAFDVFNNESQASTTFDVETDTALVIRNVYNYPDPFSGSTAFTFQRTDAGGAGEPINVTIKVFTISGRLIRTIKAYGITSTFVKIDWDGLDAEGDRLANGVYLYTVTATTIDGKYTSEALGKMAVLR